MPKMSKVSKMPKVMVLCLLKYDVKTFLLEKKVKYKQNDDNKDCQELVLNHPQV